MYSPKIYERYIPPLYRLARSRGVPMTRLVAEAIEAYLAEASVVLLDEGSPISGRIEEEWKSAA